jgi:hypothetical protein
MAPAFTTAPADERVLSVGAYLLGLAELGLIVAALGYGSWRLRRAIVGGWTGAPALLCDVVIGVSALIVIAEILGTAGLFGELEMILASLAFAGLAVPASGWLERRDGRTPPPPAPPQGSIVAVIAVAGCAAVVAGWMVPTLGSLAGGMDRADTLWYHMPLAAKFVQTGSLGDIFFFDPVFFASFYPSNSEILHALPILTFGRDIVSPALNLGLLAVGLLASWCIGRPYGMAPQALIGGSVALGSQMLVEFQAGESLNDITGVVFILASVAVLVNGYAAAGPGEGAPGRTIGAGALAVAGLGAGLAAGMKLSFLAPVAALTLGVVILARPGTRVRASLVWTLPLLLTSVYWYARNAIATGNPIPYISSVGPIELPAPERAFELRPGFSVSHYLGDVEVWWDWFIPGLNESFGELWPLTIALMLGGAAAALWWEGEPVLRMLGATVLFTALVYLFTPLTAAGEEGQPIAFVWNVRYIAPAVAIALATVPCLEAARLTARRRAIVTGILAVLLAATVASLVQWHQGHTKGAIAAAVGVLALAAAYAWLRSRGYLGPAATGRSVAVVMIAAVAVASLVGWYGQRHYLERRYENTSPRLLLAPTLRWARDIQDARVAVSGIRGVFNQYPLYGTDLSNHVQWLGRRGEHDAWLRIPTCEEWRRELNEGSYTHVVTTYDPFHPGRLTDTREALWTREDPAARQVLRDGPVSVFEIEGEMSPEGCAGLPDLSPSELNGDSVNIEPLANQPPGTGPRAAELRRALEGS